jgi:hypothetical protein
VPCSRRRGCVALAALGSLAFALAAAGRPEAAQGPVQPHVGCPGQPTSARLGVPLAEQPPAALGPALAAPCDRPLPINLPTALRLAGVRPLDIELASARIRVAAAQLARARVLWLPTVFLGGDYFRHDGQLQDVAGNVFGTSKQSVLVGAGPYAVFAVTDALFEPLAARQVVRAREAVLQAARNDALLAVAEAYFNVQEARGNLAAAADTARRAEAVLRKTSGLKAQGVTAPVDELRARVEVARRVQAVQAARERWRTASAELARVLRLDPAALVEPLEPPHLRITLVPPDRSVDELTDSVLAATSSSRYMVPLYWPDPKTGIGFQVQVEVPQERMRSALDVELLQVLSGSKGSLRVRDVARVRPGTMPGEYDRYNMRRLVSLTANVAGEDLGRVAGHIDRALQAAGAPPRGAAVDLRGQVVPMREMFRGLAAGLALAVAVIFLLLTAYFQSPRLALLVVLTTPAVVAGVAVALAVTGTTLNIQSFMKEGDVLAELSVPEMAEELAEKKALVAQAQAEVEQAKKVLAAAEAELLSAGARVNGEGFPGKVTRSAWALDPKGGRTLRTEIDLKNPGGRLRPGMYAIASLAVEHAGVLAVPASALVNEGELTFIYWVEGGKARRTPVTVGLRDKDFVEVGKWRSPGPQGRWQSFTGAEEVLARVPPSLGDGQAVTVSSKGG